MVLALVTGLSTTVAVVTINNLQSSMSAQQAGSALNAADAGVAQACKPAPGFGTIARFAIPKIEATPRPFRA